jgi:hypothetical protein
MAKTTQPDTAKEDTGVDKDAPAAIVLEVRGPGGDIWGTITAEGKEFKTGSRGFYANGKVINPKSGSRYQLGANIILIGSKK